ncbi:MAG: anti-sigma factor domain-containing protein [Clostridia bacterium]|nr:anti-sigma factor domain-containing protein [Clostridia bacterium]
MKAVVMEIHNKHAVVLDKQGCFIKIKNTGNLEVGAEIDIAANVSRVGSMRKAASIAAALVFMLVAAAGVYSYNMPYSYVNVDINPSIEITSNIFDRIIRVEALNNDGEKVLNKIDIKSKAVNEGIAKLVSAAAGEGYLSSESQGAVMLTISGISDEKVSKLESELKALTEQEIKADNLKAEVIVEKVDMKQHDDAKKVGVSPGKMLLMERLKEVQPEAKLEELKDAPVKAIMKSIREAKKDYKDKKEVKENKNKDSKKIMDKIEKQEDTEQKWRNNSIKNQSQIKDKNVSSPQTQTQEGKEEKDKKDNNKEQLNENKSKGIGPRNKNNRK